MCTRHATEPKEQESWVIVIPTLKMGCIALPESILSIERIVGMIQTKWSLPQYPQVRKFYKRGVVVFYWNFLFTPSQGMGLTNSTIVHINFPHLSLGMKDLTGIYSPTGKTRLCCKYSRYRWPEDKYQLSSVTWKDKTVKQTNKKGSFLAEVEFKVSSIKLSEIVKNGQP